MTTRLITYNSAIRHLGELRISGLTESRPIRRILDDIWDDNLVNTVLEEAYWKFASRSVKLEFSPNVTTSFGYKYAFAKPADFIQLCQICSDEYFSSPLTRFTFEAGYWYSDVDEIYIQYISNGASYGADLSVWPESFSKYVALYMAAEAAHRMDISENKLNVIYKKMNAALIKAKSKDALNNPTKFLPPGEWTTVRSGGNGRDGGSRGGLIG